MRVLLFKYPAPAETKLNEPSRAVSQDSKPDTRTVPVPCQDSDYEIHRRTEQEPI
jgi:hypothetical protein